MFAPELIQHPMLSLYLHSNLTEHSLETRCCHITVAFAMAASKNGVCITQQMCNLMIKFQDCSMIKDE